ncbi:hypothetical protein COCCU_11075 [Corynebacterium occultum]|uniref:Glycosyltransferase RgtA/B/C/D-like domain-containing protein n=1 Tax=Corynebacterium occultum TaxID=2675219 RepID=A0A6B8W852_9CORY|nr:hypothetical protein COCCU_11075 [Corynebacterium occultum]
MLLIFLGVVARTLVASRGWFYWDDLTLQSQARLHPSPDLELLFSGHDGHLMPAAWFLEWLLAHHAPLDWPVAVILLAVLQTVAAAAVGWASWVLCPRSFRVCRLRLPWAGLPLLCYLVTPLTLSASTWLAAVVNALPMHAGLAMMMGHAVLWFRSYTAHGARRNVHLFAIIAWLFFALIFNERALLLGPVVIFTLCCFTLSSPITPVRARKGMTLLSVVLAIPSICWALLYLRLLGNPRELPNGESTTGHTSFPDLLEHGYLHSLLPTAVGGPWQWERWHPGPPFASPGGWAIIAGLVVVLGIAIWTARQYPRLLLVWLPTLLYPLLPLLALLLVRSGPETAAEITQTLRHLSEVAVLAALALAVVLNHRTRPFHPGAGVPLLIFLVSALLSTLSYTAVWADQPGRTYFSNLRTQLSARGEPILDQAVPLEVLLPVVHPHNQLSHLLPGATAPTTTTPVLVDAQGMLIDAVLSGSRSTLPGETPGCGTLVGAEGVSMGLDGPLLERDWVVEFNYFAEHPGAVELSLDGEPSLVPLVAGLNQVFVSVVGGGESLQLRPTPGVGEFCVADSHLGILVPGASLSG